MKILITSSLLLALISVGCVSGSVNVDNVCSYEELATIPPVASGVTKRLSHVASPKFSDATEKIDDLGDVTFKLKNITFSTKEKVDISFLERLSVSYVRDDLSEIVIAETTQISGTTAVVGFKQIPQEVSDAVKDGSPKFRITGTGTLPAAAITPTISICASATAMAKASISDIK
jgi:hypothetical protein